MKITSLLLAGTLVISACAAPSKFKAYDGPQVTQIILDKSDRELSLISNGTVLKKYKVELGFAPDGAKEIEGDGRTPEGAYTIDRRNPNSRFHLSIGISYPNKQDRAKAAAMGKSPGGDIFIHGGPRLFANKGKKDWTAGCISVSDKQIETIYAMVDNGTPIWVQP